MKIYTRTGDDGTTGLFGGARVMKSSLRVDAYGTVDEANAVVGTVRAAGVPASIDAVLAQVQEDLFVVGAELACVPGKEANMKMKLIANEDAERLERAIDEAENGLPALKSFVLPGGTAGAAALHVARTVTRRAERIVLAAGSSAAGGEEGTIRREIVIYLNRLSDLLFTLARRANHEAGVADVPWRPRDLPEAKAPVARRRASIVIVRGVDEDPRHLDERSIPKTPIASVLDGDLSGVPDALVDALKRSRSSPQDDAAWDDAEEAAAKPQRPDLVASLYWEVISGDVPAELVSHLGQRAARFHDEWFDEAAPLVRVLDRVLERDPASEWAFERLSLLMTSSERWAELLDRYDRAIAAAEKPRRMSLLDEAVQIAKDFAGQPERAVLYLEQLFALRPSDAHLATTLERLLEREERHEGLIRLWTLRLPFLAADAAITTRERIATAWLDRMHDPRAALAAVEDVLAANPSNDTNACGLLERMLGAADTPEDVRARSLTLLEERYASRPEDVIRVLNVALPFADREGKASLHRRLATRLVERGDHAAALEHWAALLALVPADAEVRASLRAAAEQTGDKARLASALVTAAEGVIAAEGDATQVVSLLSEAGEIRSDVLGDDASAIEIFSRVTPIHGVDAAALLPAAKRLVALLEKSGKQVELLDALERLVQLEPDEHERREVNGQAAKLAHELGMIERELAAWQRCLDADPDDAEALDATIEAFDRIERWEPLITSLEHRATLGDDKARKRADRVRVAGILASKLDAIDRALDTWRGLSKTFGENDEVVDALGELLTRSERWDELIAHLEAAAPKAAEPHRSALLLERIGDVERKNLGQPAVAIDWYVKALDAEPGSHGAREGLEAILAAGVHSALAVDALLLAYSATDDWQKTIDLLEHRLVVTEDPAAKTQALRDTATLHETRGGDAKAALVDLRRALPLSPESLEIETDLLRLAEEVGSWRVVVDALRDAILASEKHPARVASLRTREGWILDEKLAEPAAALEAMHVAFTIDTSDEPRAASVVRLAATTGAWEVAAGTIVALSRATKAFHAPLLASIESWAESRSAWNDAVLTLEKHVATAIDLEPAVASALEQQIGLWHRDRRSDPDAAELSMTRAVAAQPERLETLRLLASLQRRAPGLPLVETLLRITHADRDDLDALHEAAEVLCAIPSEHTRARALLRELLDRATDGWKGEEDARPTHAQWAIDRMVEVALEDGAASEAVELLQAQAKLPFERAVSRAMRRHAAEIAADSLKDVDLSVRLLGGLLDEDPGDLTTVNRLAELYAAGERTADLLALRRHELGLTPPLDRRLDLRLEAAKLLTTLGQNDAAIDELIANLGESAGEPRSVEAVTSALTTAGQFERLTGLLEGQADELEAKEFIERAASLWREVARVSEDELKDVPRSIAAHRRAVKLDPRPSSLEALARMHAARGEFHEASGWLEQRLYEARGEDRRAVVLQLADAYVGARRPDAARTLLEEEVAAEPAAEELRARLATLYRSEGSLDELSSLLMAGAEHAVDAAASARYLREAAVVAHHSLRDPARAVGMLKRAAEMAPDERAIRVSLADALREAGELLEARTMLERLIEEFGRRRTPERAALHFQIALVARAEGKLTEALEHLELATGIDMAHVGALRLLGELSREAGALERAERAFRSLLLVVRRLRPADGERPDAVPGPSEVLLELHRIAAQMGQEQRASEILESAFEAAADAGDALRFESALRTRGDSALLLRALRTRLSHEPSAEMRSKILDEIGTLLDANGDLAGAFDVRLQALEIQPAATGLLDGARALASRVGQSRRLADHLVKLADDPRIDPPLACDLLLAAVEVLEADLQDIPGATAALARAQATESRQLDVARAQARLHRASGDTSALAQTLRRLVDQGELSDAERVDALYDLAGLELANATSADEGVERLRSAIELDPRLPAAATLLRTAADAGFSSPALTTLYERVARDVGEPAGLLDALRRMLAFPEATAEIAREAVQIATDVGTDVEPLLERAVQLASEPGHERSEATWAQVRLSEIRKHAGDAAGALRWMTEAFESADPVESFQLGLQLATIAAAEGGDLALALRTYQRLLDRDPGERAVWVPMLDVARRAGDRDLLESLLASVVDRAEDLAERSAFRLERAKLLLQRGNRADDAIALFNEILDDDPSHEEAASLLTGELEKAGRSDDLIALLERRLDAARDRQDATAIVAISFQLGALLVEGRTEDARQVYRSALEWAPNDLKLLRSLLDLYGPDDDVAERADVLEKVAALETGATAVMLSLELAELRRSLDDEAGTTRALELGYRANPADTALREKLEAWFTERQDWSRLAAIIETDAAARPDANARAARFRESARLVRDQMGDAGRAADLLAKASEALPHDLPLLDELARSLVAARRSDDAITEVSGSLDQFTSPDQSRVDRLLLRAELRAAAGHEAESIGDLEEAVQIGGPALTQKLSDALFARLERTRAHGDRAAERDTTHRLVKLLLETNRTDDARALLGAWLGREPSDLDAARRLLELDSAAERWEDVAAGWRRMLALTTGDARVQAVLQLADVCDRLGRPADAREPLERIFQDEPASAPLRLRLQKMYETVGAYRELSSLHLESAQHAINNAERISHLSEAGKLLLYQLQDPAAASVPIFQALTHQPADHELTVLLVDAYLASGQLPAATQLLTTAVEGHRGRRSRELSQLQHRMARAAYANGDRSIELEWLAVAFESDGQNAQVASELAQLAMEFEQWDVALKPLRSLTLMKNPSPVTKAMAYLWQGIIAYRQGDPKRAGFLAKKGLQEDPNLQDARDFLAQIGQ